MAGPVSVRGEPRYAVTPAGREMFLSADICRCNQLWVSDGAYRCHECGTIYGVVYGFTVPSRRAGRVTARPR